MWLLVALAWEKTATTANPSKKSCQLLHVALKLENMTVLGPHMVLGHPMILLWQLGMNETDLSGHRSRRFWTS